MNRIQHERKGLLSPALSSRGGEGEPLVGSWPQRAIPGSLRLSMNRNAKRTVSPLTPALSPLRGEGEPFVGLWPRGATIWSLMIIAAILGVSGLCKITGAEQSHRQQKFLKRFWQRRQSRAERNVFYRRALLLLHEKRNRRRCRRMCDPRWICRMISGRTKRFTPSSATGSRGFA